MHTRPVSLHFVRFGLLLTLALSVGVLPACDDDTPTPAEPGVARLDLPLRRVSPGESLVARCVADDAQGGPLTYVFDWGNGADVTRSEDAVASGLTVEQTRGFTEAEEGSFNARCRAVDAEGHEGPWSVEVSYSIGRPPPAEGELDVRVEVLGQGRVTSAPQRLDCPGACRRYFDQGTEITLTPVPEAGWRFVGWAGGGCGGRERKVPYTFRLGGNEFCMARFAPVQESSTEWWRTGANPPGAPAWSPDGTRLASLDQVALGEYRLLVWDLESGRVLNELRGNTFGESPSAMAWSPSGDRLAISRNDGFIEVLDAMTWATVLEWRASLSHKVRMLAWSPTGLRLASVDERALQVNLWNPRTGAAEARSIAAEDTIRGLAWSPDGNRLALEVGPGLYAGQWQSWVELRGASIGELEKVLENAESFAWSPDGTRYAVGALREVRVYERATHQLAATWDATRNTVSFLDWSADGRWLATGDRLGGLVVLAADTGAVVVDGSGEAPPGPWGGHPEALRLHPSKPVLALVGRAPAAVNVVTFDAVVHTTSTRELLPHANTVHAVAWSPAGDRLASSGDEGLVRVWDPWGAPLRTLSGHGGKAVRALAWDARGTRLASGGADGQVCVWNVEDGTLIRAPLPHVNGTAEQPVSVEVHRVALSPDGSLVASVSESKPEHSGSGTVRVWDLGTGAEVFRFPRRDRWVQALTWSGEGRYLLAADSDMTWELWDRQTGEVRRVDPGMEDVQTLAVALSPDGTRLALGSQDAVHVRDLRTGELLQSSHGSLLAYGDFNVSALAWSPDGRFVAGGGGGGLVFAWDTEAGLASSVIGFHAGNVSTVSWRADGRAITTGGSDAALSTWRFMP